MAGVLFFPQLFGFRENEKCPDGNKWFDGTFYRILFNLVSVGGLAFILVWGDLISASYLFVPGEVIRYLSLLLSTIGVFLLKAAFKEYSFKSFIGLHEEKAELKVSGILRKMRHPIYSATILIVIAFFLFNPDVPTLITMCCILVYLPIGIFLEERKLIRLYGNQYLNYKAKVPSLLPRLKG